VLAAALFFTVLPLWSAHYLPLVDLPQHLHLINVLNHLDDPNTLYPEYFQARGQLTPYLGYYEVVRFLAKIFPLFAANQLFLTLVAILAPISVWSLLSALGRNRWLCLLACPLFYGDNLYWGFINFCAALPLLLFSLALFIQVLEQTPDPKYRREIGLGLLLIAVQLTHIQAFFYAAIALPMLLLMTPSDRPRRIRAVASALPGVLMFAIYSIGRLGDKPDVAPGAPWHAWGPIFSSQNLSFQPVGKIWEQIPNLLAGGLSDHSDSPVVWWLLAIGVLAAIAGVTNKSDDKPGTTRPQKLRGPALAAVALAMLLFLPFDIRGYIYYVNLRFAELFALLLIVCLPMPADPSWRGALAGAALIVSAWYGINLSSHFRDFDREANAIDTMIEALPQKPKIMALSVDTNSAWVTHPVYLHFASYAALARGGITSFSFAATPHSPVAYKIDPPPAPASEWRAMEFNYGAYGRYYDHYLARGRVPPQYIFRNYMNEVSPVAQSGSFVLYRRNDATF
jgi:hypothetical protein